MHLFYDNKLDLDKVDTMHMTTDIYAFYQTNKQPVLGTK